MWKVVGASALALVVPLTAGAARDVPVTLIDGLPVVTVELGDIKADFVLDTGGQIGITIPRPLINDASKVRLEDENQKTQDAAGHTFIVQKLTARSVIVGGVALGSVEGLVHYQWGLSAGPGGPPDVTRKGAIGLKALSTRNILFDLQNGRLTLFERGGREEPDLTGWSKVPFEYDARGVVVKLDIHGSPVTMALDTAATASMLKTDAAFFAKTRSPCAGKQVSHGFCGMLTLKDVVAGGGSIGNLSLAVVQMGQVPFDGLLGSDFFYTRQIYVDFETKTLYVRGMRSRGNSNR